MGTSTRREQILEATLDVLAEGGTKRLTFRAVDARAHVPPGTASNHFPTWDALVTGGARHLAATCHAVRTSSPPGGGIDEVVSWLDRVIRKSLATRRNALAFQSLQLESAVHPEIRPTFLAARDMIIAEFGNVLGRCGSTDAQRHAELLFTYVNGALLDQLTDPKPGFRPRAAVEPLVRSLLGSEGAHR